MKTLAALLAGVLLVALALAGSSSHRRVSAGRQAAVRTDAPHRNWRIGSPISFDNLTIFPVLSEQTASADDFITLDEGLRTGKVVITELGADGRSRRLRSQRRIDDNAEVNRLAVTNKSGKRLILIAGEMVIGGKQDRIVGHDCIIEATARPVPIDVFCVEHGRWSQRASYADVDSTAPAPVIAPAREARKAENFYSLGAVAHPKLRAAAQDKREQTEVWKEVSANNERLGTKTGTDTYQQVYASREVADSVESYVRALERELTGPDVVGVVVARNGKPVWADVFASQRLFARYWPKLLKSYAVEALSEQTSERRPTEQEATRYLYARDGQARRDGRAGVYELVRIENPRYAVFELWDTSLAAPARLHFNKAQR